MRRLIIAAATVASTLAATTASAASIGDVIRATFSDPYLVNGSETRMVFPDRLTVESWGSPSAVEVPGADLPRWNLSGAMPIREGAKLVKFGTDPQVYAVGPHATLHWITDEHLAEALYGKDWNRRVVTLFYSYWPNYRLGSPVTEPRHPDGTLIKYPGSPTVYYMMNGIARPFRDEVAFEANRFSFDGVVTVSDTFGYRRGNEIIGYEPGMNLGLPRS